MLASELQDDVNDDRGSKQGGNGIQGDDTTLSRYDTQEIAKEGGDGTHENGGGQEGAVIIGGKQHASHMGNSESDEGNRSAESSHDGSQQSRHDEQPITHTYHVDAQVLGIAFAQHQGIKGFY